MINALPSLPSVGTDPVVGLKALCDQHPGKVVFTTSMGLEDQALTDLIARNALPVRVVGFVHLLRSVRVHARRDAGGDYHGEALARGRDDGEGVARDLARGHGDVQVDHGGALRTLNCFYSAPW